MGWSWGRTISLVAGVVGLLAGVAEAQPRYRVMRIIEQTDASHTSSVQAIDDLGRAAGFVMTGASNTRAATMWDGAGAHALPPSPDGTDSEAYDLNGRGEVVGRTYNGNLQAPYHAVKWANGQIQILPVPSGFPYAEARGINTFGDVIGSVAASSSTVSSEYRAAFWHDGQVELIGQANTWLADINYQRKLVGCQGGSPLTNGPDNGSPFVWENGQIRTLTPLSSGAAGCAQSINDQGVIVGRSAGKPVMWQGTSVQNLGPANIPGRATSINNRGEVIGELDGINSGRTFYRPANGPGVYDLRSLIDASVSVTRFVSINSNGQILGTGSTTDGQLFAALLEPYQPSGTDTQPPSIKLTSPAMGEYVVDTAVLEATVTDNVGVAGVQFFVEGSPVGPEVTAPPYKVEADLLKYDGGPLMVWARARDTAGNVAVTNIKSMVASNRCSTVTANQTISTWMGTQTGTFTVRWTGKGSVDTGVMDGGFALSSGRQTYFSTTVASVLWAPDRELKVRNGASYPPSGFTYNELFYRFRAVVDVPNNRYSVWVHRLNQPETQLAADYVFRKAATSLDYWMMRVDETAGGDFLQICNVAVKAGP
jgi:uncharacterized membrane protein